MSPNGHITDKCKCSPHLLHVSNLIHHKTDIPFNNTAPTKMSVPTTPIMSAPSTPTPESIYPPTKTRLPDSHASTGAVRAWILAWHTSHGVSISAYTLSQITWTGAWIHEQPPAKLESEIFSWGVPQGRGRMMALDLVRERRGQVVIRQKSWSEKVSNAVMYSLVMRLVRMPRVFPRRVE